MYHTDGVASKLMLQTRHNIKQLHCMSAEKLRYWSGLLDETGTMYYESSRNTNAWRSREDSRWEAAASA